MRKKSLYLFLSWLVAAFLIFWVGMFRASEAPENKTQATWTETCTWIGATGGTWSTASNWNCNGVNRIPTATDQVVIDANVTVNLSATTTIDDLVLGDSAGTYAPILNFSYDAVTSGGLIIDESNATVHPNAQITHSAGTTVIVGRVLIDVQAGGFTLNGSINVTGKGYAAGQGPGQGADGGDGSGAGYGGEGGNITSGGLIGGTAYGSLTAPTDLGSGGGIAGAAGVGGGAVQLTVTGTTTISGTINADGTAATGTDAGGGSGGSVYITTGTFTGAGTVAANGLNGNRYGGAGGGGRIAVHYTTDSSTVAYQAYGGVGNVGAAGTIYKKPAAGNGEVIVDNGNRNPLDKKTGDLLAGMTLTNLEVKNYGRIHLAGTATIATINLTNNGILGIDSTANITYTTLNWNTSGSLVDRGGTFLLLSSGGDLTVPTGANLFADTARSYTSVTVNGMITHTENTTVATYRIDQTTSGNYTIAVGGSINVTGKGYAAGQGPGQGADGGDGSGAGYGGEGGNITSGGLIGGTAYGSLTAPTDLGSGGGIAGAAGAGGGAAQLTVTGTTTISGSISTDGVAATGTDGGGGSGGSVYITTGTLAGAGTVMANGLPGNRYGGAGGGGRIAVYYTTDSSTVAYQAYGGVGNVGAAGTIYKKPTAGNGNVIVDNGNRNPLDRKTGDLSAGITLNSLEVTNYGRLHVAGTATIATINLTNNGTLQLEATANITNTTFNWATSGTLIDRGGVLDIVSGGGNLVVPSGAVLYADSVRSYTNVTVSGTITTTNNTTTETYKLNYTVSSNVTINSGGKIDVSSKGYSSSEGTGQGTDSTTGSGGGAYGGNGGAGLSVAGGTAYGLATAPNNIGSGGGQDGVGNGGKGGGAAILAITGTLQVDGSILADGGNYVALDSGGGAGGSIYVTAGTFAGSGTVYARGGNGLAGKGGGGGGGRIAILYTGWTWLGNTLTDALATSGGTGYTTGAIGTVYLASSNQLPSASNVSIDSGAVGVNLTAGSTTSVSCTATITDLDGYLDIDTVTAKFFRTGVGYGAADDDNKHYSTICSGGSGSGTTRPYTCIFGAWFHAEGTDGNSPYPTDDWTCRVTPNDSNGEGTSSTDTIEMNSLSAVSISTNIVFSGGYAPGTNSGAANEVTDIYNAGNLAIDIEISGSNLCTDFPTCSGSTIVVGNLEHYDTAFTYGAGLDLTSTPVLNSYNIARSIIHPSNQYRTVYWGIGIPSLLSGGNYTGQVQFTAVQH